MAIIKTAILQTHVYTDKFRNITQAAELLASPELQGIDLVVLPEMFCCPYENKFFPEYAEPEGGETWENVLAWLRIMASILCQAVCRSVMKRGVFTIRRMFLTGRGIRSVSTGRCIF